jgi:flagellar basal-body rod modification protein FlgD
MPTALSSLLPSSTPTASPLRTTGNKSLGKNEFLKLLVTQLKNQDPMNPANAEDFAAQLAQFSGLEQLLEINSGLAQLAGATAQSLLSQQTALAAGMIGRTAMTAGTEMSVDATGVARVAVELSSPAQHVTVRLVDSSGRVLETREFQNVGKGRQNLAWQPAAQLTPGIYTWTVDATDANGKPMPARQLMTGVVDGLAFENGQVKLRINGATVAMEDLLEVS